VHNERCCATSTVTAGGFFFDSPRRLPCHGTPLGVDPNWEQLVRLVLAVIVHRAVVSRPNLLRTGHLLRSILHGTT